MRNHPDDGKEIKSLASGEDKSESVRELLRGYGHPDGKKARSTFDDDGLNDFATVNAILGTVLPCVVD